MKQQIKLSPAISEMAALCYQGMTAAREYARNITNDPNCPYQIAVDFRVISASLTSPLERIDKRIPKETWAAFKNQIKDNDAIRLEEVKRMYVKMVPEQQEWVERLMTGILNGELINFESIEKAV